MTSLNHPITRTPCPNCGMGEGLKAYSSAGFRGYTWPGMVEHCEICGIIYVEYRGKLKRLKYMEGCDDK